MKPHYDFSKAQRGKFYREGAVLRLPIYLNLPLQQRLERIALSEPSAVADGLVLRSEDPSATADGSDNIKRVAEQT